ncbi:glycosyltransferase [Candidatus Micrarchaeota archaeon]|nr:glycosyltransferase [Candidatus Micrarchaeota archaeon]
MAIKISVIIACRNEKRDMGACLTALQNQQFPQAKFEVVVVDGNSTDGTVLEIEKFRGKIKNLRLMAEKGRQKSAANARNQGSEIARGNVLVFFDADIIIDKHYLLEIDSAFKEGAFAAASNVKSFPSKSVWASLREHETMASDYLVEKGRGLPFPNIFSAKTFRKIGGYMPRFRYGEDLLLVKKLVEMGIRPVLLKKAVLMHRDPDTLLEIAAQSRFWGGGFLALFKSNPRKHLPRLALVCARALWLPLFVLYLFSPFNLLLLLVAIFYIATIIDGAYIFRRSLKMGGTVGHALLMVPFRMIRSFFFLEGFIKAFLGGNKHGNFLN